MIDISNIVVWINDDSKTILIAPHLVDGRYCWGSPDQRGYGGHWCDPIGAAYTQWREMNNGERVTLMLHTVIDLAMQGYPIKDVVSAFAQVAEFRALGRKSYPMCRALTSALLGRCLEPNGMSFDELLVAYANRGEAHEQ
jgi:hypothetical protein